MNKSDAKRQAKAGERRTRKRAREDWWKQVKCFWTWPFGHVWEARYKSNGPGKRCKFCPAEDWSNHEQIIGG